MVLSYVTDPVIMKFWRDEYDKRPDKQVQETIWPITNKVGQFLSSTVVRNIFSQPHSKINIRQCMDEGKILLINLSKGRIWDDNASMIGSFLVTKFYIDAMSRADIPACTKAWFLSVCRWISKFCDRFIWKYTLWSKEISPISHHGKSIYHANYGKRT
jgi:hypothetical protein